MSTVPDRVISVSLSDEDWRAFLAKQPEPVQWLREQIARTLSQAQPQN